MDGLVLVGLATDEAGTWITCLPLHFSVPELTYSVYLKIWHCAAHESSNQGLHSQTGH